MQTYFTIKQLAVRYSVHPTSIWRWVRDGKFPKPNRLGDRCTRWPDAIVSSWEKEQSTKQPADTSR